MTKKIVFFDVDGTLVDDDKVIPQSTKEAISALQKNGIYIAIASGRAPFMLEEIACELQINSFVSYNGQYVVFEGKEIYKRPLPQESLERLIEVTTRNEHPLVFSAKEEMRVNLPNHPGVEEGMSSLKREYPKVDANFYRGREIFQCLLFCEETYDPFYTEEFKQYSFMRWHDVSVDVCPADGSKARGIFEMIKQLGILLADTYAFGDGLNDIQMLTEVGTGVAMGNGRPELKAVADYITADVSNDGIAKALQHFELI